MDEKNQTQENLEPINPDQTESPASESAPAPEPSPEPAPAPKAGKKPSPFRGNKFKRGGMATVMDGQVDRIILTGEIARSRRLTERLTKRVQFIAPVETVPGAVEMQALVAGALRMLRGEEAVKDYDTEHND